MNLEQIMDKLKNTTVDLKVMEVCGTHTSSIFRNGIKGLISPHIKLVSGPGCPVCVTTAGVIDQLTAYAMEDNTVVVSFGDMFRVRGSKYSLADIKAEGGQTHLMYTPFEVIQMAKENPGIRYIIAAVGFETTTPVYAALLGRLEEEKLSNIKLYTALKTMPPVLEYVLCHETIDAFLCPGHVSVVIGSNEYRKLSAAYEKPFVIAGFEAEHILAALYDIVVQKEKGISQVKNLYTSVVASDGQKEALRLIDKYFEPSDAMWRGIGQIKNSGYVLKKEYSKYSANRTEEEPEENTHGCRCADVILGRIEPTECPLFGNVCSPKNPIGACMVSSEGSCRIWKENNCERK